MTESPLRTKEQRMEFCDEFFSAVHAPTLYTDEDYREYQLPRDVDRELTDRPYYWLWVEQTGQEVEPTTLRLAFSESAVERENKRLYDEAWAKVNPEEMSEVDRMFFRPPTAELVSLGGFRLERIMDSVRKRSQFICAHPHSYNKETPLIPWILMNAVISYSCDLTEQEFVSLGLCLTNGQIVEGFWQAISRIPMEGASANQLVGSQSLQFEPEEGVRKVQQFLTRKLERQPHQWAADARDRLEDDLQQLDLYYNSLLNADSADSADEQVIIQTEYRRKRRELIQRAEPKIEIDVTQLGLIGLLETSN